jgi:hypothetical protein
LGFSNFGITITGSVPVCGAEEETKKDESRRKEKDNIISLFIS